MTYLQTLLEDESQLRTLDNTTKNSGDVYIVLTAVAEPTTGLPLVKIGWGKEGRQRIIQWLSDYPSEWKNVKDVMVVNKIDAFATEKKLHTLFQQERQDKNHISTLCDRERLDGRSEWFVVSDRMNQMFVESYEVDLYQQHKTLLGCPADILEREKIGEITLAELREWWDFLKPDGGGDSLYPYTESIQKYIANQLQGYIIYHQYRGTLGFNGKPSLEYDEELIQYQLRFKSDIGEVSIWITDETTPWNDGLCRVLFWLNGRRLGYYWYEPGCDVSISQHHCDGKYIFDELRTKLDEKRQEIQEARVIEEEQSSKEEAERREQFRKEETERVEQWKMEESQRLNQWKDVLPMKVESETPPKGGIHPLIWIPTLITITIIGVVSIFYSYTPPTLQQGEVIEEVR